MDTTLLRTRPGCQSGEQFVQCDHLLAAGAESADAEAGAEGVSVLAASLPEKAGFAVGALVAAERWLTCAAGSADALHQALARAHAPLTCCLSLAVCDQAGSEASMAARQWHEALALRARGMRCEPTAASASLWTVLSRRPFGLSFWSQHVIGGRYIADFYCPAARLAIEVHEGAQVDRTAQDQQRRAVMDEFGIRVLRLDSVTVLAGHERAIARVLAAACRPRAVEAQRCFEQATRRGEAVPARRGEPRERQFGAPAKLRYRCTWCLADFIAEVVPAPSCRRCHVSVLVPVCCRCAFRRCDKPGGMCGPCTAVAVVARSAVGTPAEHVNRNSRHRVRKVL